MEKSEQTDSQTILSGICLVIDPSADESLLLKQLGRSLAGGTTMVQIWNHWPETSTDDQKRELIGQVTDLSDSYSVPVLINEDESLLNGSQLAGVHYDHPPGPERLEWLADTDRKQSIAGLTCTNDLERIEWAETNGFSYVSFCSMFPSSSVNQCDLVDPESVKQARAITNLPLFISGGLTPDTMKQLPPLDIDGVAVISGILKANDPEYATQAYIRALKRLKHI